MDIRYLIGIRFGEEETIASYIDLEEPSRPMPLHLDLQSGIRHPINEITCENKEEFKAHIKLVFCQILKNQTFLTYNPDTGSRNFDLWVACPSGWNSDEIKDFENFLRPLIPLDGVMRESDASYYKLRPNNVSDRSILVIDVGYNSIDFSYYDPHTHTIRHPKGFAHGINQVEQSILEYLEDNDETFQKGKEKILASIEEEKLENLNWMRLLRHYIKWEVENFYSYELELLDLNLRLRRLVGFLSSGCLLDCEIDKETLENTILKNYKNQLKSDFEAASNWLAPEIVIMTGVGIRMPWLMQLAKDVLTKENPQVKLYKDSNPTDIVSEGMASYAITPKNNPTEANPQSVKERVYEYAIKHSPNT